MGEHLLPPWPKQRFICCDLSHYATSLAPCFCRLATFLVYLDASVAGKQYQQVHVAGYLGRSVCSKISAE